MVHLKKIVHINELGRIETESFYSYILILFLEIYDLLFMSFDELIFFFALLDGGVFPFFDEFLRVILVFLFQSPEI